MKWSDRIKRRFAHYDNYLKVQYKPNPAEKESDEKELETPKIKHCIDCKKDITGSASKRCLECKVRALEAQGSSYRNKKALEYAHAEMEKGGI